MTKSRTILKSTLSLVAVSALAAAIGILSAERDIRTLQGEVVRYDARAATIVVRPAAGSGDIRLAVNAETKLVKGNRPLTWALLERGDRVVVNYRTEARGNIALNVAVLEDAAT